MNLITGHFFSFPVTPQSGTLLHDAMNLGSGLRFGKDSLRIQKTHASHGTAVLHIVRVFHDFSQKLETAADADDRRLLLCLP